MKQNPLTNKDCKHQFTKPDCKSDFIPRKRDFIVIKIYSPIMVALSKEGAFAFMNVKNHLLLKRMSSEQLRRMLNLKLCFSYKKWYQIKPFMGSVGYHLTKCIVRYENIEIRKRKSSLYHIINC